MSGKMKGLLACVAIAVVLLVIGALTADPEEEEDGDEVAAAETTTQPTEPEEDEEGKEEPPPETTTTEAPETTTTTTTGATTTTAPPQPVFYSGSGTTVLEIDNPFAGEGAVMHLTHNGGSNFAVWTLDQDLVQDELAVNTIGAYDGILPLDILVGQDSKALEIDADGAWTVEIRPLTSIRSFDAAIEGVGDDVVLFNGDTMVAEVSNQGSSNFAVWLYGASSDLLVNEIGPWSGSVPVRDSGVMVITAEGPWTISGS